MIGANEINQIESIFNPKSLKDAIDLDAMYPISLSKAQNDPILKHFFWLDENGPFSEITQRGLQSIRKGFFKIHTQPYYKTTISPGTFAATIYYYNIESDALIKYHANIGPLTNTAMRYSSIHQSYNSLYNIPMVGDFARDRDTDNYNIHYLKSKERFYNKIFDQHKIIFVREAIWDPAYPTINKIKRVTWCFIDI
jgi:hypothetical protein